MVLRLKTSRKTCSICGKSAVFSKHKPHSLHRTRRIIYPNLQKHQGKYICTSCLRTLLKEHSNQELS